MPPQWRSYSSRGGESPRPLGLAWEDVDIDAGTAHVRRASVYVDGHGQRLGPTKTDGARGEHWLMPTVVTLLTKRCEIQAIERAAAPNWQTHTYEGEEVNLVFTTPSGGLVLRQAIAKLVKQAARTAGIEADLGTHAGRRTVVTSLFVDGHEALEDIARFVGHAKPSTTAGYVKRLGRRPRPSPEGPWRCSTLTPRRARRPRRCRTRAV